MQDGAQAQWWTQAEGQFRSTNSMYSVPSMLIYVLCRRFECFYEIMPGVQNLMYDVIGRVTEPQLRFYTMPNADIHAKTFKGYHF